ncbi:MAG: SusC/RagA family TonB-linked outer membrane protein [Gemmatimonadaceae bacterium]
MRLRLVRAAGTVVVFAVLVLLAPERLAAQTTGTVQGRVVETGSQQPVGDVQVSVVGTTLGGLTNAAGEYTVANVPVGAQQVRVRRLGFRAADQSITVASGTVVRADFTIAPSAAQLEQVVVTGTTGAVERRTVGNSITQVAVAELTERNSIMSVSEILQGKSPGVTILPGSGAAGTAGEIRIRGAGSINGYQPVVFIDGIRYNIADLGGFSATGGGTLGLAQSSQVTSALNWLNPNDIESIEVIKGPAASTLYGAEAANGVIQIITKKGSRGQQSLRWGFRAERGQNEWRLSPADNYTTCDAVKQAATVSAADPRPLWPGCQGKPVNTIITGNPMMDDPRALRVGDLTRLSMTVRGGGDRYSLYLSGDRDIDQGVFFNNDVNRTSVRSNFSFNPNDKTDFSLTTNWQNGRIRLPIQDESANGLLLSALRGFPGRVSLLGTGNEGWRTIAPEQANLYRNFTSSSRLTIGATANYRPFSWFRNRATIGIDNTTTQAQLLFLPTEISAAQDADAAAGANLRRTPTARLTTLNYNGDLDWRIRTDLQSTTSFGAQVVSDERRRLDATGIGLGAPDVTLVNLAQRTTGGETFSEDNSVGYYVQQALHWKERLYLTGAVRADDHSSFGENFDIIVYPKVSVSYIISDEPAAKGLMTALRLNSLKLRGAWGQAGRAPSAYSAPQTYTVDRVTLGTATGSAARTASIGNPDLKPEKGQEIELGFEASGFGDRIGADVTYYNKKTSDMLQSISVAPSTGFISTRLTNLGEVTNKGVELSLFGTPVDLLNVRWETRLNLSTNSNELLSFGIPGKILETPGGQAYGAVQQHRPGYPLGGFWVTPPQRGPDGAALLTPAGAAIFNPGDSARRYIGPSTPTREIGFSNTVTLFKYFRLYGLFDYKGGNYVFNLQERNRCQGSDNCWRTNNPRARFPQTAADSILFKELAVYRNASTSPEWIQKGDFIKLREISLTFDAPRRVAARMKAQSLSFIFSGRNLALWSDYEGIDPEVNSYGGRNFVRIDAYAAPMMRRLSAAINLQY